MDNKELQKAFKDDHRLARFYELWLKNGMDAKAAYQELDPQVTEGSAKTLGSRLLAKVDHSVIMEAIGLDQQMYFEQLKDGLQAQKWNDFTGEREADHKTRKPYHDKLGKLLKIETETPLIDNRKIIILDGSDE